MADTFTPIDGLGLLAQYGVKQPTPPAEQGPPMPTPDQRATMAAQEIAAKGNEAEPGRYEIIPQGQVEDWQKSWREKEGSSGLAGDAQRLVRVGANSMVLGLREAVRAIPKVGPAIVSGLDEIDKWATGKDSETILRENIAYHEARLTPEMAEARKKEFVTEKKDENGKTSYGLGPAWSDPRSYAAGLFESAAPTAASMLPGGVMARGAYLRAVAGGSSREVAAAAAARAALIGGAVSEAIIGGGSTAADIRESIQKMPEEVLQKSDAYQDLLRGGKTPAEARTAIMDDTAVKGLLLSGLANGLFGGQGDRVLAKMIAEGVKGSIGKRLLAGAARGAVAEGLLEEAPQSAGEKIAENYAMRDVDPSRELMAGVPNAAVSGAITGGLMGAGFGGAGGGAAKPEAPKGPLRTALDYGQQKADERDVGAAPPAMAAPATSPAPANMPGAGESVMVRMDDGTEFPARVDGYKDGDAVVTDPQTGELLQVPVNALRIPTPDQAAQVAVQNSAAPAPEMPVPVGTTSEPTTGRTKPVTLDTAPDAGKRVILTNADGQQAPASVGGYVAAPDGSVEALVKPDGKPEVQVPLSQLAVSAMSKSEIERENRAINPPVAREVPAGPAIRKVGKANMELPDERHARLYDLGVEREQSVRLLGKSRLEVDKASVGSQAQLAEEFGVGGPELGQIADDYRYRVQAAARKANSDLPIKMPSINAKLLDRKRQESAKAAEQAAQAPAIVEAKKGESATDAMAHEAATSPTNDIPQPTDGQKDAGNYKKGHIILGGLDISVENPAGSKRSGVDKGGKAWSVTMKSHYGYIKGTVGRDKDHIDVFIKPGVDAVADTAPVFVIDQVQHSGGKTFDEHKVMIGFGNPSDARRAYLSNYAKGWTGLGQLSETTLGDFKEWLRTSDTTKPYATMRAADPRENREVADNQKPAKKEATDNAGETAARAENAPVQSKKEPVKWFGARDRAQAYVDKKGLGASHDIVEASAGRFEVRPKKLFAENANNSAVQTEEQQRAERLTAQNEKTRAENALLTERAKEMVEREPGESDRDYFARLRRQQQGERSGAYHREANDILVEMVTDFERFELPLAKKISRADVSVARTPLGWTYGMSISMPNGSGTGYRAGPYALENKYLATREEAIAAAVQSARTFLERDASSSTETEAIQRLATAAIANLNDWEARTLGKTTSDIRSEAISKASAKTPAETVTLQGRYGNTPEAETEAEQKPAPVAKPNSSSAKPNSVSAEEDSDKAPAPDSPIGVSESPITDQATPKPEFAGNKLFTADKVAAARARLRSKMNQLNAGIDPEVLIDGITIAGAYVEQGVRKFSDYAKAMTTDFGENIKPYLLSFWEGVRHYPGLDTKGMTSPEQSKADFDALMQAADTSEVAHVIGEKTDKAPARKKKTGAATDQTLTQDWGVDHIDGYGDSSAREVGNDTKDAFLQEAKNYLRTVASVLTARGYEPYADRKGKPMKPVSVNEAGPAVSGEVSLSLLHPESGAGVWAQVGTTSLRGVIPSTKSGVSVLYRATTSDDQYGTRRGQNVWAPVTLTAGELAEVLDAHRTRAAQQPPAQKIAAPTKPEGAIDGASTAPARVPAQTEATNDAEPDAGNDIAGDAGAVPQGVRGDEVGGDVAVVPDGDRRAVSGVAQRDEGRTEPGREDTEQRSLFGDLPGATAKSGDGDQDARGSRAGGSAGGRVQSGSPAERRVKPKAVSAVGGNFRIEPGAIERKGSWRDTALRNVEIVELVKTLDREGRRPTDAEKALLTRFTGWGASEIANSVFGDRSGVFKPGWEEIGARLKAALTPEEYAQAKRTTQYAHYTGENVIRPIYAALERMGFAGGRMLEPGSGIGLFNGLMPATMAAGSTYTGIEYDAMTGRIGQLLYPESNMVIGDYSKTPLPRDYFDAAIGNPPFSSAIVSNDPEYKKNGFMLHDYFFAKTIDRVKPGGVLVFVTSKGTMDKSNDVARRYLAARANLIGAIRLPQTAFKDNAGTEVVTDIIFLQKRGDGVEANGVEWKQLAEVDTKDGKTPVNEYFAAHPEMVLGTHALTGSMYRANTYTLEPKLDTPFEKQLADAVARLPENIISSKGTGTAAIESAAIERDYNPKIRKEGGVYIGDNGQLMQVDSGAGVPLKSRMTSDGKEMPLKEKETAFLKDWAALRDALKVAYKDQLTDGPWEKSLAALRKAYDGFVERNGRLSEFTVIERTGADGEITTTKRFKNDPLLRLDVEGVLAHALEKIDEATGEISPDKALTERVLEKRRPPEIKTVQDALFVSLNEIGRLDLDKVAALAGLTRNDAISTLGSEIYQAPDGEWQTADKYLSGNVVQKLKDARAAAAIDKSYQRNVEALLAVQPRPLVPSEITVNLGQNWIKPEYIRQFADEVLGENVRITYAEIVAKWDVSRLSSRGFGEYNTPKMSAADILNAALNNREIKITERDSDGKSHVDTVSTEVAMQVATKMKEAFRSWIWADKARAEELSSYYNEHFNNIAPRKFDGSHLTLPGVSSRLSLYPHQKRAIWRAVQEGDTYLAHAVGAGKTFTMIAIGMEERRLGLSTKPMFVVPNHMLAQFSREFLELYPAANVMVADEHNFHTGNRRRFMAQAALNNPDAIVITHSSFGRIGMSDAYTSAFIQNQIDEWNDALDEADKGDRFTIKQIERQIEQLEKRLEGRMGDKSKKDQVMTFEELGVDRLIVDEGHEFRKLDFATNQGRIKGIDPSGSQRAMDLHMKVQYLRERNKGRRSIVMASGTPVTNTMGELFTVQRLFQPDQLAEDGHAQFDAWANQYGAVASGFEQNAAGAYEIVARFAQFMNVPELMRRVRTFMDILTSSDLGSLVKRPNINGGGRDVVVTDVPNGYKEYQKSLTDRITTIRNRKGKVQKGDDIILNVIADGRFSAIDMRFVDPKRPNDPKSKLNRVIDDIIDVYQRTANAVYHTDGKADALKGSSIVLFTDIGLGEQSAKSRGFEMRDWIAKRLAAAGIPESHVAFMQDFTAHAKKERLFADMREGKKRILIGGKNMETGVNVQKRLAWLGHLDAPWFPASVEQREGRIVRQGNQNPDVTIKAYATKGSYDSTMWGMNARKARFIEQAMSGDESVRSMQDVSEASAFEVAAALASGDERYLRVAGLKSDVERLERLALAHHDDQRNLSVSKSVYQHSMEANEKKAETIRQAIEKRQVIRAGAFSGKVGGTVFDSRDEFSKAVFKRFADLTGKTTVNEVGEKIAELGGYPLMFRGVEMVGSYKARVNVGLPFETDAIVEYPLDTEAAVAGIATRAANIINGLDRNLMSVEDMITDAKRKIAQIDKRLGAPFPEQGAMLEKLEELHNLQNELTAEAKAEALAAVGEKTEAAVATVEIDSAPSIDEKKKSIQNGDRQALYNGAGELMADIAEHQLGTLIEKLAAANRITVVEGPVQSVPASAQAWTNPDGTIVLRADNITRGAAMPVLMHEMFHSGAEALLGNAAWGTLMDRLRPVYRQLEQGRGPARSFWEAARASVSNAEQAGGQRLTDAQRLEEFAAYAIEHSTAAPRTLALWVDEAVGRVKAWVLKRFGKQLGNVSPGQLRAIAAMALRDQTALASRSQEATQFSTRDANEADIDADRKYSMRDVRERAVSEINGKLTDIAPAMLAAVPLNYFSELKRPNMTAIDDYLRIKRSMDTYRGAKHEAADKISQEWLSYAKLGIGKEGKAKAAELADLMHESTLTGVDPSLGVDQFEDGIVHPAYEGLRDRYTALPEKGRALFNTARDAYTAQSREMDQIILDNVSRALEIAAAEAQKGYLKEIERIENDKRMSPLEKSIALQEAKKTRAHALQRSNWTNKARMSRLRSEFESSRMQGPYFPLARFGRYFVTLKDVDGAVMSFQRFETAAEMQTGINEMRALTETDYPGARVEHGVMDDIGALRQAMDPRIVAQMETLLAGAEVDPEIMDSIWQRYLQSMPEMSIRKRQIHRKGTAGFNKDAMRVFANHMFHAAHQMARTKYGMQLQESLNNVGDQARAADDTVRATTLSNELRKRHQWVMNPTGSAFAQKVTSAMFVWYLAASPASAIVNLTQTVIVGLPIMGARLGGISKAALAVTKAAGDFIAGRGDARRSARLSTEEKAALDAFYESGLIDRTRSHDLAGVGNTGTEYSPLRARIMDKISWMFHQAEVFNRETTALAAYRLAREQGQSHEAAVNTAHDLTWKTHFDYSNSNRPRIMQGDVAKVALVFQNFQINMWYRFFRDFHQSMKGETPQARREARYQLAGMMGMLTLMGGITSVFGFKALMALAGLFFDDKDDPRDFEEEMRGHIIKHFGADIGAVILKGVPGRLLNVDLASRVGMADFLVRTRESNKEGRDAGLEWIASLFGASVSTVLNGFDGVKLISEGKVARGVEIMAPKAIKDLMQAYRFADDGLESRKGNTILERDKMTAWDIGAKAIGFTSGRVSETYERNRELANAERRVLDERKHLVEAWAAARIHEDDDARAKAMQRIRAFNQMPYAKQGIRITAETLQQSYKVRQRNSEKREEGVLIENKGLNRFIRDSMPARVY